MRKEETIGRFIDAIYMTLECQMCAEKLRSNSDDDEDLAEKAWKAGWRVQPTSLSTPEEPSVLCQYCTDDKR